MIAKVRIYSLEVGSFQFSPTDAERAAVLHGNGVGLLELSSTRRSHRPAQRSGAWRLSLQSPNTLAVIARVSWPPAIAARKRLRARL
jgi:hypothetical protein